MRIEIQRQVFESLDDIALIWACIEPAVRRMRGKSFEVKSTVLRELTSDQRALLMFQIIYGHMGGGLAAFFGELSYLLNKKEVWTVMKDGIQRFGDMDMARIIGDMEEAYDQLSEGGQVDVEQLGEACGDVCLQKKIGEIETALIGRLPRTAKRIGTYIREYPDGFVQVVE